MLKKHIISLLAAALAAGMLTGCSTPQIFEEKKDPNKITEYSVDDIVSGKYYVKTGTRFFMPYAVRRATINGTAQELPQPNRLLWLTEDEGLVPVVHKGDTLILKQNSLTFPKITLERFKDIGYTDGMHGAVYSSTQDMIAFSRKNGLISGSNSDQAYSSSSEVVYISSFAGKPVTKEMLDASGEWTGLEKNKTYAIEYYAGTVFKKTEIRAYLHTLVSWESLTMSEASMTKRGYLSYEFPEDLPSGYYYVSNAGLIKYIAREKGNADGEEEEDMNIPYYSSEEEQQNAYSQSYSVSFAKTVRNPVIEVTLSASSVTSTVLGRVTAPDGSTYMMVPSATSAGKTQKQYKDAMYLQCSLEEAMAGKWTVYISPKTIVVYDVQVLSNAMEEDTSEEITELEFASDTENVTFFSDWTGGNLNSAVYGYIEFPDGKTYEMKRDPEKRELYYNTAFIPAGRYKVRIYHQSNVTVTEASTRAWDENIDKPLVSITE